MFLLDAQAIVGLIIAPIWYNTLCDGEILDNFRKIV